MNGDLDSLSTPTVSPAPLARVRSHILLVSVLLVATLFIVRGIGRGEFNYYVDETQHAMTGMFLADVISDHPFAHPIEYAYRYYAQYPAISLGHWPPFFYVVEAVFFLIFGPTAVAARLALLLFSLVGLYFWFRLVADLLNEWAAAAATLILALLPPMLLFEKTVMLEVPSVAVCIAASYCWMRFLRGDGSRWLYGLSLLASLALLTKQHSGYLVVFCLLTVLAERKWRWLLTGTTARAVAVAVLLVGPYYAVTFRMHWQTITNDVLKNPVPTLNPLAYYWLTLPTSLGWPLLSLSILGMLTCWWWARSVSARFMFMWIVACYVSITPFASKEPRYIMYWLPAFVFFAVGPLTSGWRTRWTRLPAAAIVLILLAQSAWFAWGYRRPYVSGYAAAARQLAQTASSGIILFDGELPANFIFYLRGADPGRRLIVMRKALYVTRVLQQFAKEELAHTRDDLQDLFKRYGIRYVIITEGGTLSFEIQQTLRDLLATPQFKLLETFPVENTYDGVPVQALRLYENLQAAPPTEEFLQIRMLTLNHDIVVRISDLIGR